MDGVVGFAFWENVVVGVCIRCWWLIELVSSCSCEIGELLLIVSSKCTCEFRVVLLVPN